MCGNENVGNITPFLSWCYPVATFQASQNDVVLVISVMGKVIHANPLINEVNIAILVAPVARLLVVEVVVPRAANTACGERLGGVVRRLARRGWRRVLGVTGGSVDRVGKPCDTLMSALLASRGAMLSCFLSGPGWGDRGVVMVLGGRSRIWGRGPDGRGA